MDIPVYLFTGFLESGKTTVIKETLKDPDFTVDEKTLIISFEEGMEEYDSAFLQETHSKVVYLDKQSMNEETFTNLDLLYSPDRVMIEYNGMWSVDDLLNEVQMPDGWILVQILSLIDASTFGLYINNMRSLIFQQIQYSEVVIFNRCDENTKLSFLRSNIKAVNPRCQIVYENIDGTTSELSEDDLPFDFNQDIIEIKDEDYGLWYMNALDNPRRYQGKKLKLKGMAIAQVEGAKHSFILGRYAMVCCADDTSLLGIVVSGVKLEELQKDMWLTVVGEAIVQQGDNGEEIIVLKALQLQRAEALNDPLVYFS